MSKSTEVSGQTTDIPGLLIFDVSLITDARGYFQEKFQKEKLVAQGLPKSFQIVQNSISYNKDAGVTRGLHAEPWDKYISVVTGRVFAAYVDLRLGENFGKTVTVEINPEKAVFLPQGIANSFQTLEADTYYLYSVNKHWNPDDYDKYSFVNLSDPELNIPWPTPLSEAIMSDKDKAHPFLADISPMKI